MRDSYDQTHANYDARYWNIQLHKYSAFQNEFETNQTNMIFDYGGGSGLLARYLNTDIVVADISYKMLTEAKKYSHTHLIAADGEQLPIRHKSVDVLTSFSAVQNLANPQQGLEEIQRVTRNVVILTVLEKILSGKQIEPMLLRLDLHFTKREISVEDIGYLINLTE